MARIGSVTSGSFAGTVTGPIWTEIVNVLIPQISTYSSSIAGGTVRSSPNAGKWEGHIVSTVYPHLRIDHQGLTEPRDKSLITWNAGSRALTADASPIRYANWQVQFGPKGASRAKAFLATRLLSADDLQSSKGSIAGIHMALANDFSMADVTTAFQTSYNGCVLNGNTFGVILPDTAYTEPIIEEEKRWIATLKCKRECKDKRLPAFTVSLGKKEGRFEDKNFVQLFFSNALPLVPCPKCASKYALEFEGSDGLAAQAVGGRHTWKYNFDMTNYVLLDT